MIDSRDFSPVTLKPNMHHGMELSKESLKCVNSLDFTDSYEEILKSVSVALS